MISIIAAIGKNRELGKDNKLLFRIPEDLKRFKELTKGHPIIMGRKTWDSLPFKPLSNRYNIVITRDLGFKINNLRKGKDFAVVASVQEALRQAQGRPGSEEVFVIGGGQIYQEALPFTNKLYLTIVDAEKDADTFFPEYNNFEKVVSEEKHDNGEYKYTFLDLVKG